jgi:hypothetical protein
MSIWLSIVLVSPIDEISKMPELTVLVRDTRSAKTQEVVGSNPVAPTSFRDTPFGEHVGGLSHFRDKNYVVEAAVQKQGFKDLALRGCAAVAMDYFGLPGSVLAGGASQTFTVPSWLTETMRWPSPLIATPLTWRVCPLNVSFS